MATRKKATRKTTPKLAPVPVLIAGYELDDQAIDNMIEMTFRVFERMMTSQNVIRALHMYADLQKRTAF